MHRNVHKNHQLKQLPVSNMSTWSENGKDIFVIFHENMRQRNCIVAIPCSDLSFCYSLNCSAFILYSVAASFPKMSISKQKSWQKMQSFPTQLVRFLFFYGGERDTCMLGVFTAGFSGEKNITCDTTMRLIMPKDTVACKGNRGERRNW